jgi:tripartite-type tricarboxylate transporter receptor subunit TctC
LYSTIWFALSDPAGLPSDIAQKVNAEMVRLMAKPEVQQRLQQDGLVADSMTIDQLKAFIISEQARWKSPIERAGLMGKL